MQLTKTIKNDRKLSWKYFSRRKKETAKVPFQWKKLGTCLGQSVRKQKFGCLFFASSVLITNTSKRWWDITNQERKGLEGISVSQECSVWYDCSWRTAWWAVGIYFGGLCNTVSYQRLQNGKQQKGGDTQQLSFNSQNSNRTHNQTTGKYLGEKIKMMNNREHIFVKKKHHQTNLISFNDGIIAFRDRGKTVVVILLYLSLFHEKFSQTRWKL